MVFDLCLLYMYYHKTLYKAITFPGVMTALQQHWNWRIFLHFC